METGSAPKALQAGDAWPVAASCCGEAGAGLVAAYVGVMAQEVEAVRPDAIVLYSDGYLRVDYDKLGFQMQTYEEWVAAGKRIPIPSVH